MSPIFSKNYFRALIASNGFTVISYISIGLVTLRIINELKKNEKRLTVLEDDIFENKIQNICNDMVDKKIQNICNDIIGKKIQNINNKTNSD